MMRFECRAKEGALPRSLADRAIADLSETRTGRSPTSWPGLSRPSTTFLAARRTWMPGTSPGMTSLWRAQRPEKSALQNRNRARPSGRSALDLHGEARHLEPGRRQLFEIVQLLEMAIADMAAGLVAFPDQAGVFRLGVFLRGVNERGVPAPAVGAGQADAALEQVHGCFIAHTAAR